MEIWTYPCRLNLDNLQWSKTYTHSYTHNNIKTVIYDYIKIKSGGQLRLAKQQYENSHVTKFSDHLQVAIK